MLVYVWHHRPIVPRVNVLFTDLVIDTAWAKGSPQPHGISFLDTGSSSISFSTFRSDPQAFHRKVSACLPSFLIGSDDKTQKRV